MNDQITRFVELSKQTLLNFNLQSLKESKSCIDSRRICVRSLIITSGGLDSEDKKMSDAFEESSIQLNSPRPTVSS
jgi:hypothetical protein